MGFTFGALGQTYAPPHHSGKPLKLVYTLFQLQLLYCFISPTISSGKPLKLTTAIIYPPSAAAIILSHLTHLSVPVTHLGLQIVYTLSDPPWATDSIYPRYLQLVHISLSDTDIFQTFQNPLPPPPSPSLISLPFPLHI